MKKKTNFAALFSGKKKTGLFTLGGKKRKKRYKADRNRLAGLRLILAPSKKKKESGTALLITAAAAGAAALPFWLLAPGKATAEQKEKFSGRAYAHRGLYDPDQSTPENSIPAFRRAAELGYGIELDVQLSKDGFCVVFHDDDLLRACGDGRRVDEVTWDELKTMRLFGTSRRIPLFRDVLALINGRVPLMVELKSGPRNVELCRSVCAILRDYEGDACIQSFDPRIVAWFRRHDPSRFRGQLAQPSKFYGEDGMAPFTSAILGNTLLNAAARPQFINYRIGDKPAAVRFSESMGALRFGWVSRDPADAEGYDAVVFEFYRPERKL